MSEQVPVRFLKNFGQHLRGDMATIAADEIPRMTAAGVVALIARQDTVETATATAPETAVKRRRR